MIKEKYDIQNCIYFANKASKAVINNIRKRDRGFSFFQVLESRKF